MGVKNMFKVIKDKSPNSITIKTITDYKDTTILIDGILMIYKNIMAIRKNGYDIMNNGTSITHIHSMMNKLRKFKELNITPIFVFDGVPPKLKFKTLEEREKTKKEMKEKYLLAKTQKEKTKYYYLKADITEKEIQDTIELIRLFGYCVLYARDEADQLLATLSRRNFNKISGIVTDDMDILIFGGKNILKEFSVDSNKKFYEIDLNILKKDTKLNQDRLIILALLLGTDYSVNVPNVGSKKAPSLVYEYKTIDGLYNAGILDKNMKNNFIDSFNIYKNTYLDKGPLLDDVCYADSVGVINVDGLRDYLKKFNYKADKIKDIINQVTNKK